MAGRPRSLVPKRWRDALRPDADLAAAEGLAAGTGLLTGTVARTALPRAELDVRCPHCAASGPEVLVVDLVGRSTTLRCRSCHHRWDTTDLPSSVPARRPSV